MQGMGLLLVELNISIEFSYREPYTDSCPVVIEVGLDIVQHVAGIALSQQFDN